ncbi:transposable element Tc3 transposase [Trichonephila clavipes]|nr:transposable element Tc3 transposase [Trichonephila clavipes]
MRVVSVPRSILSAIWLGESTEHGFAPVTSRRDHYWGPGFVIWGGMLLNRWTELKVFDRGSVAVGHYCTKVIFSYAIEPDFVFMDDNAWPHRIGDVQELLESENISRMENGHVRKIDKKQLQSRNPDWRIHFHSRLIPSYRLLKSFNFYYFLYFPWFNYYSNLYFLSYSECRDSRSHDHYCHYGSCSRTFD